MTNSKNFDAQLLNKGVGVAIWLPVKKGPRSFFCMHDNELPTISSTTDTNVRDKTERKKEREKEKAGIISDCGLHNRPAE
ncbi:hypothetical protein K0M31_000081 [Melipona bicolor]|uniref:Uncharacterized protein n=1 Tax=Melipona bicolor TaxID=60889 RepID=A0AA40GE56_9HYME|nr:hypothetical protein K0M31_000081 [Melipona bicolor]